MVKDGTVCANQKVLLYVSALPCPLFSTEKVDGLLVWEKVEALLCSTRRFMCIYCNKKVMQRTVKTTCPDFTFKKGKSSLSW